MRAIDLEWTAGAAAGKPSRELRTGACLSFATFGKWSRFQIAEYYQRPLPCGKPAPVLFALHDAERVTDAEVRAGGRSPIIARSHDAQRLVDHALSIQSTQEE